jgi:dipeptidyl aminopeptidase/acylaminoacyl peptidase
MEKSISSRIIIREEIKLNETQTKMVISGWGKEVFGNSVVEKITYLSDLPAGSPGENAGGLKVKGYLAYPKSYERQKFPCIIWNRGGYLNKGAIDRFNARGIFGQIASWGYVVFASQYRGNDGGEGREELGGEDVNDILNLIPLADELPMANKDLWGIEGWSRGGMMTLLTLRKNKNFKCSVLVGAISNLKQIAESNTETAEFYKSLIREKNFEHELEKRSAINFVHELPNIPYLIIHGGDDKTVSSQQSIELSKRFSELNIHHKLVIKEGGDHYLKKHRKQVDEMKREWYGKWLK